MVDRDARCKEWRATARGPARRGDLLLDCRNDAYFASAPASGSWLATHWNVADSAFQRAQLARVEHDRDAMVRLEWVRVYRLLVAATDCRPG